MNSESNDNELLIETIQNLFQEQKEKLENISTSVSPDHNLSPEIIILMIRLEARMRSGFTRHNARMDKQHEVLNENMRKLFANIQNRPPDRTAEILTQIQELEKRIMSKKTVEVIYEHWISVLLKHRKAIAVISVVSVFLLVSFTVNIYQLFQYFSAIVTGYWNNC